MSSSLYDRRTIWRSIAKTEEKAVVPWFSMTEWKSVRDLLYSEVQKDHEQGYFRLCGWKARCQTLPAPVECSLSIFHVLLGDPDYLTPRATSLAREQELRLMYSTAVMRFLNLMLGVHNEDLSGTMYSRASMRNIPEWLVNLRHDAAHGKNLPELSLLRAAALFIRKWLYEYYWEDDNQETTDWIVTKEEVSSSSDTLKELNTILETWEALSIFKLSGFSNLNQIPYSDLQSSIHIIQKLQQSVEEEQGLGNMTSKKPAKVSSALSLLETKLKAFMKKNLHSVEIQDTLCDMLIKSDVLLPSENLLKMMNADEKFDTDNIQSLPPVLEEHWSGMMFTLWEVESIPVLLRRLINTSIDENTADLTGTLASLWVQKIMMSCIKVREARKVHCALAAENKMDEVFSSYKASLQHSNRKEVLFAVSVAAVENQRDDLKAAYTWRLLPLPESVVSMDLIHFISSPPPQRSCIFLPAMFELVSPPIPQCIQDRLMELVTIYNKGELEEVVEADHRLYSVSDVTSPEAVSSVVGDNEPAPEKIKSIWEPSQEHLDWGSCPLGLLPWQQKQQHHDMKEYEKRQQQRTWSRLSIEGPWKINESGESNDCNTSHDENSSSGAKVTEIVRDKLRVVQNGRVSKAKMCTPQQNKIKAFRKLSPNIVRLLQSC